MKTLRHLCRDDMEALDMIDQILENPTGNPTFGKNNTIVYMVHNSKETETKKVKRPSGNSRQAGLRKLRSYAEQNETVAELREKVLLGELSVNAALLEAGLRKKRVTIPKKVDEAAEALRRIYTEEELLQLIQALRPKAG